jgi:hypothetical protein
MPTAVIRTSVVFWAWLNWVFHVADEKLITTVTAATKADYVHK